MKSNYINVSVLIPYYNSQNTIDRAILSIKNQTLKPKEIIIINDGSCEADTIYLNELKEREKELPIKIIHMSTNSGVASARNMGWLHATQDYIALLDADDSWAKEKLEKQYEFMFKNNDAILSGSLSCDFYKKTNLKANGIKEVNTKKMLFKNHIITSTAMFKRSLPIRFIEGKRYSEDYLLWLEMSFIGKIYVIQEYLSFSYKPPYGHSGLSSNLIKMELSELYNYKNLFTQKKIGSLLYISACTFSFLKFIRRVIISKINNFTH